MYGNKCYAYFFGQDLVLTMQARVLDSVKCFKRSNVHNLSLVNLDIIILEYGDP